MEDYNELRAHSFGVFRGVRGDGTLTIHIATFGKIHSSVSSIYEPANDFAHTEFTIYSLTPEQIRVLGNDLISIALNAE